jgi:hypothetical protein
MFNGGFDLYEFMGDETDFLNSSFSFLTESAEITLRRLDGSTPGIVTPLGGREAIVIKEYEKCIAL